MEFLFDQTIFNVLVGVGSAVVLFIYGIEHLSHEIEQKISAHLKGIFSLFVRNKWIAAIISALATALIQSSSATTVITVGLVEAGIISFQQSLGIIAGANVGTTITAQLVALDLSQFGPALILCGFLITLFGRQIKILGKPIFYLGFLLFSLHLIGDQALALKDNIAFQQIFVRFNDLITALLAGTLLTAVVQSSSVVTGIVVVLAQKGILSLHQALPIVLGANIGTTVTCMLAASRMRTFAKKTALAHLLFNIGGVVLFIPLLPSLEQTILSFHINAGEQIALAHAIFNITCCIIFLLLSNQVVAFLDKLGPTEIKEHVYETKFIPVSKQDARTMERAVRKEILRNVGFAFEIIDYVLGLKKGKVAKQEEIRHLSNLIRFVDGRIKDYILRECREYMNVEKTVLLYKLSGTARYIGVLTSEWAINFLTLEERHALSEGEIDITLKSGLLIRALLKKLVCLIEGRKISISREKHMLAKLNKEYYEKVVEGTGGYASTFLGIAEDIAGKLEVLSEVCSSYKE